MQMFIWKITDNRDILPKYDIWIFPEKIKPEGVYMIQPERIK